MIYVYKGIGFCFKILQPMNGACVQKYLSDYEINPDFLFHISSIKDKYFVFGAISRCLHAKALK